MRPFTPFTLNASIEKPLVPLTGAQVAHRMLSQLYLTANNGMGRAAYVTESWDTKARLRFCNTYQDCGPINGLDCARDGRDGRWIAAGRSMTA